MYLTPWWRGLPRDSFGDTPALRDELLALVLSGAKTATCWAAEAAPAPLPGGRTVIEDGHGKPACVIETVRVLDIAFDAMSEDLAVLEGEGDLAAWRAGHEDYFRREGTFRPDMALKFEIFRVIEVL